MLRRVYYNHFWTLTNVHSLGTAKDLLHLLRHTSSEVLRLSFSEDLGSSGCFAGLEWGALRQGCYSLSMVPLLVFPQSENIFTDFATEGTDAMQLLGRMPHLHVLLDVPPAVQGLVRAAWTAEHLAPLLVQVL